MHILYIHTLFMFKDHILILSVIKQVYLTLMKVTKTQTSLHVCLCENCLLLVSHMLCPCSLHLLPPTQTYTRTCPNTQTHAHTHKHKPHIGYSWNTLSAISPFRGSHQCKSIVLKQCIYMKSAVCISCCMNADKYHTDICSLLFIIGALLCSLQHCSNSFIISTMLVVCCHDVLQNSQSHLQSLRLTLHDHNSCFAI